MPPAFVRISRPRHATRAGVSRVEADVDGVPVWFESSDAPLSPAPEAWGSAFLIPALRHGRDLALDAEVDPVWADHMRELIPMLRRAWRFPGAALTHAGRAAPAPPAPSRGRGLFFSAGVDSFHALLCTDERPDTLVHVHGFDVPLDDPDRQRGAAAAVRAIAAGTGRRALFMRTNVREHPLVRATLWDAAHGGALAAAGLVLGGVMERVAIGSSQPRWSVNPWGSHWSTDPLWTSSSVRFVHLDPDLDRLEKIRHIAPHALVQRHLRVCWSQSGERANCSRCEKCMHTMLGLADAGYLAECASFDGTRLLELVRSRRRSRWRMPMLRELSRSRRLEPALRSAVRDMYVRSVIWKSPAGVILRGLSRVRRAWRTARRRGARAAGGPAAR